MSHPSKSLELNEQQKVRIPLPMLVTILAACAAGAFAWASLTNAVTAMQHEIAGHEARIRQLEENQQDLVVIRTNVDWIKKTLEQSHRN